MKKFISLITIIILSLSLISCGNNKTDNSNNVKSNTNDTSINKSNEKTNITYTKEFSYLPAYGDLELQSITTATDKNKMRTAKYIIKNSTTEKILNGYADILKKDGWTVNMSLYKDGKPFSASAQKDKHVVIIVPQQNGSDIILTVTSV